MKRLLLMLAPAILLLSSCKSEKIKEPEYRDIRDVRIIDVGLLQTTAGLDLVYYNPNDFGVTLSEARGDVYIDNAFFGRFGIQDKVTVRKRNEFIVPAIIKMDNISAIKNHREIFQKKQAMIRIEGFAIVRKAGFNKEVPIKYEGMQDLERLRAIVAN
jgi:LEA14-like dessication related protein